MGADHRVYAELISKRAAEPRGQRAVAHVHDLGLVEADEALCARVRRLVDRLLRGEGEGGRLFRSPALTLDLSEALAYDGPQAIAMESRTDVNAEASHTASRVAVGRAKPAPLAPHHCCGHSAVVGHLSRDSLGPYGRSVYRPPDAPLRAETSQGLHGGEAAH